MKKYTISLVKFYIKKAPNLFCSLPLYFTRLKQKNRPSLHKEYSVRGIQDNNLSLSTISFILVGEFVENVVKKRGRAEIFNQLIKSKIEYI